MNLLEKEIQAVREKEYKLSFRIPTPAELAKLRVINRDRTEEERNKISKAKEQLRELNALIASGVLNPKAIPELQELIRTSKELPTDSNNYEDDQT